MFLCCVCAVSVRVCSYGCSDDATSLFLGKELLLLPPITVRHLFQYQPGLFIFLPYLVQLTERAKKKKKKNFLYCGARGGFCFLLWGFSLLFSAFLSLHFLSGVRLVWFVGLVWFVSFSCLSLFRGLGAPVVLGTGWFGGWESGCW